MYTPAGNIPNYWMFADATGDNVVLVAFKQAGVYTYLYFGDIIKVQAWTGSGVYFGASSPMVNGSTDAVGTTSMPAPPGAISVLNKMLGAVKVDVDTWVGKWAGLSRQGPGSITSTGRAMQSSTHAVGSSDEAGDNIGYFGLRNNAASSRSGGLIMLPTIWLVERDAGGVGSGGGWSIIGTVPNIFQSQTNGFVPGTQFNISTDQYMVFPGFCVRKYP
jgi:hypothetical protein